MLEDFMIAPVIDSNNVANYMLRSKNDGDVIIKCKSYLEITNLNTVETVNVDSDELTIFPNEIKTSIFILPTDLAGGEYSVLGILGYGDQYPLEAI